MLHRITQSQAEETTVGTPWSGTGWAGTTAYQTNYAYGPNGNITHLTRYGQSTTGGPIDDLTYRYTGAATPTNNPTEFANNQLLGITDAAGSSPNHTDITTQPSNGAGNTDQNYRYDGNGSLIQDLSEEIGDIAWTSEKKLYTLTRTAGSTRDNLRYVYDFQGNRITKVSIPQDATQKQRHQVYVRDPQGNTLAIYQYEEDVATSTEYPPPVFLKEQLLYGSDRLGTIKRNVQTGGLVRLRGNGQTTTPPTTLHNVQGYLEYQQTNPSVSYTDYDYVRDGALDSSQFADLSGLERMALRELELAKQGAQNPSTVFGHTLVLRRLERTRGKTQYELKNFRGDLRQVVSDVKHRELDASGVVVYTSNVLQVTDGYPFGWEIAERSLSTDLYRFGFNGKENDSEYGEQLIQDYGFRLYNPAIGKFLSVDPLAPEYPFYTPYQFAGNKPIQFIDRDGLEPASPPLSDASAIAVVKKYNEVINDVAERIWEESFVDEEKTLVVERGFILVERKIDGGGENKSILEVKNHTSGLDGSIYINKNINDDEVLVADFHTHPIPENKVQGIAFSAGDIYAAFKGNYNNGYVSFVEAGSRRFAMVMVDADQAKEMFESKNRADVLWQWSVGVKLGAEEGMSYQQQVKNGTRFALFNSGVKFYETTNEEKTEWQEVTKETIKKMYENGENKVENSTPKEAADYMDKY